MNPSDTCQPLRPPAPVLSWDIFCRVIDNYGDIGVCWRFCTLLAQRGQHVRLHVDDASALQWMAPGGHPRVQVLPFEAACPPAVGDVVVEAFGCELPLPFAAAIAQRAATSPHNAPAWFNLEYLSAESYVERCHGLESPIAFGPAAGLRKTFFYPGFTATTGGLLRESDLLLRQQSFDQRRWRAQHHIAPDADWYVGLFCYEPPALAQFLRHLARQRLYACTQLLLTHGRASAAVHALQHLPWARSAALHVQSLPRLTQADFDGLLWSCDLNFVRGEDSLVRALWAGKPFVWHVYEQQDHAHHAKLAAFLDWLGAPQDLRAFHAIWNGVACGDLPPITPATLQRWQQCAAAARARLLLQDDLVTQILRICAEKK